MNISPPGKKPFILTLLKGEAFLFFGVCLLSVFLYLAGTRQEFMDSTQLLLIRISVLSGAGSAFLSLCGMIADLVCLIRPHRGRQGSPPRIACIRGIAGYLLPGLTGGLIAVLGTLITAAAGGNVP
jgi:hypothetical protein